jgi:hypothetical protein
VNERLRTHLRPHLGGSLLGSGGNLESHIVFLKWKIHSIFAQPGHNQRQNQCRQKYDPDKAKEQGQHCFAPPFFSMHAYFNGGRSPSIGGIKCKFPATATFTERPLA